MKKITVALLLTLFSVILVGCGDNKSDKNEVALSDIMTSIQEQIASDLEAGGVSDALIDGELQGYILADLTSDKEDVNTIYAEKLRIDPEKLSAGYVLAPMMNVKSDEIILLEATDEEQVDTLKQALEEELQAQIATWQQYLPDQFEKVENNVITTNGRYLLYVTYDNPDAIVKIFNDSF